ncbi:cell division protein ZapA [Alteriqipengyuania lutimaris]|uniref:Cell division protein ZapA n=1 Tax=Alteriqipengyuania lutimaris TaxID=1538146 RepID=A0A395LLN8_9SPHN|nr:cell division protein ZapA [Alteriqipengyuania lutimaris]MBB3033058.1 DNA repair exonuclease SbcCD ATPase subunit [Alteriqipengyuania lutimaris]RDS77872.1 cell division protein ZapA [Alteriqipengyuania lutimaris]
MSKVEITIGGREFVFTCGPDDEPRVRALATAIDEHYQPLAPRFSQNLLFACLRAADDVFDQAGVTPGEDPETKRLREQLEAVEHERDRLEAALSAATDARGRLERDMRTAREEAREREDAESKAQADRIALLENRCEDLQHKLEAAQMQELPFGGSNGASDDPDLLPALERFAGLLESCADKLEGRVGNA